MIYQKLLFFSVALPAIALGILTPTSRAGLLVQNGGLEDDDVHPKYVDQGAGYMSLPADSTAIGGWTVAHGVTGTIAWGNSDKTGGYAADGFYFVDLTGVGNDSPNGAIDQTLTITPGVTYAVSLYIGSSNDSTVGAFVDGVPISLSAPFGLETGWTNLTGSFVGSISDPMPTLEIANLSPGGYTAFVDNISVTPVPEPSTRALLAVTAGMLLGVCRKRFPRRRRFNARHVAAERQSSGR